MIKPNSILEISCGGHSKLYETKGKEWALFIKYLLSTEEGRIKTYFFIFLWMRIR